MTTMVGRLASALSGALAFAFILDVPAQAPPAVDARTAWFTPVLEVDEDAELCGQVRDAATQAFFLGPFRATAVRPTTFEVVDTAILSGPIAAGSNQPAVDGDAGYFAEIDGRRIYVSQTAHGGCGGFCESSGLHASLRPFPSGALNDAAAYENAGAVSIAVPQHSHEWLRSSDGRYFVGYPGTANIGGSDTWTLVNLTASASWQTICVVRSRPSDLENIEDPRFRETLVSLRTLDAAAEAVAGRAGYSCGTGAFVRRLNYDRMRGLEEALYRPWHWLGNDVYAGKSDALPEQVERWAALGVFEQRALAAYREQRAVTAAVLAEFYVAQFGWSAADARSAAHAALSSIADRAFTFSSSTEFPAFYNRGAALELRRAILERRSLDEIRGIAATVEQIDGDDDWRNESLLSVAVTYPEALEYLLDRGADVDRPNAFGKTPLMYAAQYHAYEAARLLLDRGADPNARTVPPDDGCYYKIERSSVTALHYAARYASPELIELLLERGAAVFIRATEPSLPRGATTFPIDWLRRYTEPGAVERNPNIGAERVADLVARLSVSEDAVAKVALDLALQAEAAYAAGDPDAAFAALRRALEVSPSHLRALGDMALVGLQVGRPADAAAAALRVVDSSNDRGAVASAWFNYGLSCEGRERRAGGGCPLSIVLPFLRSWVAEPTAARAEKIRGVMEGAATCVETRPNGSVSYYLIPYVENWREGRVRQHIYVVHPSNVDVRTRALAWRGVDASAVVVSFVARYEFGGFALTEFESYQKVSYPAGSREFSCNTAMRR